MRWSEPDFVQASPVVRSSLKSAKAWQKLRLVIVDKR